MTTVNIIGRRGGGTQREIVLDRLGLWHRNRIDPAENQRLSVESYGDLRHGRTHDRTNDDNDEVSIAF